jgi:alkylation response protein AidB-like acyl-CoA dehydrogenase
VAHRLAGGADQRSGQRLDDGDLEAAFPGRRGDLGPDEAGPDDDGPRAAVERCPDEEGAELSLFLVDADAPGLTRREMEMNLEMPDAQFSVFFDDVRVGADRLVGDQGRGLRAVFDGLNPERVIIASISAGLGRYAMAKAQRYARERSVWGRPIGSHQGLAHPLAEAHIQLEAARLMIRRAATLYDAGEDAGSASNMAKFLAAEAGIRCMDAAIEVHGGSGFTQEVGLGGLNTLARLFKTVPITREMILNHVAEHTLGLPKSY